MKRDTLSFIHTTMEHLGEAAAALMWGNRDEVEAHLAKAAQAIAEASEALTRRQTA